MGTWADRKGGRQPNSFTKQTLSIRSKEATFNHNRQDHGSWQSKHATERVQYIVVAGTTFTIWCNQVCKTFAQTNKHLVRARPYKLSISVSPSERHQKEWLRIIELISFWTFMTRQANCLQTVHILYRTLRCILYVSRHEEDIYRPRWVKGEFFFPFCKGFFIL